jgi:predicted esterase YcpF (UPF0227 family)
MKILYLHGFASAVKKSSKKYDELSKIGEVVPFAPDYCQGFDQVMKDTLVFAAAGNIQGIVGTSMGGYTASHIAAQLKVPFVAINPSITPSQTLKKYVGKHQSYDGSSYELKLEHVDSYADFNTLVKGLIIVSTLDEVIPAEDTQVFAKEKQLPIINCDYGDHRFEDISPLIEQITKHLQDVH